MIARKGMAVEVSIALIALASSIVTVVFDKESDRAITNFVYMDDNASIKECLKSSKIMLK